MMTVLQMATCALITLNAAVFILGTKAVFRSDRAKLQSYCFMVAFGVILATSLWGLFYHTTFEMPRLAIASVLAVISAALFMWASLTIRSTPFTIIFSPDTPEFLVETGPYGFVRHPFYTSYLINFFAAALASDHLLAGALSSLAILALYVFAARQEEAKFTASALRSAYLDYTAKTGMFFPKLMK